MIRALLIAVSMVGASCGAASHSTSEAAPEPVLTGRIVSQPGQTQLEEVQIHLEGITYGHPEPLYVWTKPAECETVQAINDLDAPLYSSVNKRGTRRLVETTSDSSGQYSLRVPPTIVQATMGYLRRGVPAYSFLRVVFAKAGHEAVALPLAPDCRELMDGFERVELKKSADG